MKMKNSVFRDLTPCNPVKVTRRCGGIYRLHLKGQEEAKQEINVKQAASFMLVSCLAYCSTQNVDSKCSSEISVDFHRIPWRYVAKYKNLHFHDGDMSCAPL
jgi:hypothetical protein